ncbi:MAG: EamA family transporter [Anaerolineae bacterium]|jgi:drug/metabolite transporter (DMT)-like permease|nr:MAG: EamA family transporter [Anaerolineae bacterium]
MNAWMPSASLVGGAAALSAAFLWALASIWFSRLGQHLPVIQINLLKGFLALLILTMVLTVNGGTLAALPFQPLLMLVISGIVGITIGDTAYLRALQSLGARRTLLLANLAPPMVGLIAWAFLDERLLLRAWLGIFLTLGGITWVIVERTQEGSHSINLRTGLWFGFLAALCQSVAVVLSRAALTRSPIDALQSTIVRLGAALLVLTLWSRARQQSILPWRALVAQPRLIVWLLTATLLGTVLAMWLQQIAIDLTPVGIVQTLLSTSPLFILPIVALQGEQISRRAVAGALVALVGVGLLYL